MASRIFNTILLSCLVLGSACSKVWVNDVGAGGASSPSDAASNTSSDSGSSGGSNSGVTTTAKGVVAGAVVGAGLGAIVGSTSGDAGAGVAIGAAAGATTGGLIGYGLERQEKSLEAQRNTANRQDVLIAEQREEIERLKTSRNDSSRSGAGYSSSASSNNLARSHAASRFASNGYYYSDFNRPSRRSAKYQGESYAGSASSGVLRTSGAAKQPTIESGDKRIASNSKAKTPTAEVTAVEPIKSLDKSEGVAKPVSEAKTAGLPPAALPEPELLEEVSKDRMESARGSLSPSASVPATEASAPPVIPATTAGPTVTTVSKKVGSASSTECAQAEQEERNAKNATSDADRLFYLRRALKLCPNNSSYHYEIGKVYVDIGRDVDAKTAFRRAVDIDPNNKLAVEQLSIIERSSSGTTSSGGAR